MREESLHARIEPDHRPAIVALHRQCHAWLPGSEEEGWVTMMPVLQRASLYQPRSRGSKR